MQRAIARWSSLPRRIDGLLRKLRVDKYRRLSTDSTRARRLVDRSKPESRMILQSGLSLVGRLPASRGILVFRRSNLARPTPCHPGLVMHNVLNMRGKVSGSILLPMSPIAECDVVAFASIGDLDLTSLDTGFAHSVEGTQADVHESQ
jgi:hypothetical protein